MDEKSIAATIQIYAPDVDNKTAHRLSCILWGKIKKYGKFWEEEGAKEERKKHESRMDADSELKNLIENPLTGEEEAKYLRAMLHKGLLDGQLNPQLLEKLDKIIGINSGEDEKIERVDFSEAFPDLASAIEFCEKPKPEIK